MLTAQVHRYHRGNAGASTMSLATPELLTQGVVDRQVKRRDQQVVAGHLRDRGARQIQPTLHLLRWQLTAVTEMFCAEKSVARPKQHRWVHPGKEALDEEL